MIGIDRDPRFLQLRVHRMADEARAEQVIGIPVPEPGGVARRSVDADETAAALQERLERLALRQGQHIARDIVPDDAIELAQRLRVEGPGLVGCDDMPALALGHGKERGMSGIDRGRVLEADDLLEQQQPRLAIAGQGDGRAVIVVALAALDLVLGSDRQRAQLRIERGDGGIGHADKAGELRDSQDRREGRRGGAGKGRWGLVKIPTRSRLGQPARLGIEQHVDQRAFDRKGPVAQRAVGDGLRVYLAGQGDRKCGQRERTEHRQSLHSTFSFISPTA
ncbi:MAG: hypothetical protein Q27BB25_05485 [Blastomonas sp. CACIA14H2]|nr:MAG: hypothetical protein Q27BB25_05485 [Blastomonas sp. CACIA14H2]